MLLYYYYIWVCTCNFLPPLCIIIAPIMIHYFHMSSRTYKSPMGSLDIGTCWLCLFIWSETLRIYMSNSMFCICQMCQNWIWTWFKTNIYTKCPVYIGNMIFPISLPALESPILYGCIILGVAHKNQPVWKEGDPNQHLSKIMHCSKIKKYI